MKPEIYLSVLLISLFTKIAIAQCTVTPTIDNLPVSIDPNGGAVFLTGSPAGGTFSGNGVLFNAFNPNLAGVGIHVITYTYVDPSTGCVSEATDTILVFTVIDNWVVYTLGTIQPKLSSTYSSKHVNNYNMIVSDLNGQVQYQQKIDLTQSTQIYQLNNINLPLGIYIATFQNQNHSFSKQLILGKY